jgi:peptidoglycan hydrolase CwlO-like protein
MRRFIASLLLCYFVTLSLVYADTASDLSAKITEYTNKISTLQTQAKSLSEQIAIYDWQIQLAQLKISQSEDQIASVSARINTLEEKLRDRSKLLANQIVQAYKRGPSDYLQILFGPNKVSQLIAKFKYDQIVQTQNRKFLYETQMVQTSYAEQKVLIEESRKKLQSQKVALNSYRIERDRLLKQTQSSEANYQKLLVQAKAELDSLKSFALYKGGGVLPPQPSPDGWYFNQRDERWGRLCIGTTCSRSPEYVWEVGCLITSVAMIKKKYGENIIPTNVAQDTSYFVSGTAYMLHSGLNAHGFTVNFGNQTNLINSQLGSGKPVIVHLTVNTSDGHYVVLKSGSNGNYIMNDPWEGPDLSFSKYYNVNSINQVVTYNQ